MIAAIKHNLNRGVHLLKNITDEQYSDESVKPYFSSIGRHMRHILDVFDCIFDGLPIKEIDLTARKRNELAEQQITFGLAYFDKILTKIDSLNAEDFNNLVNVTDDLGLGKVNATYTLQSVLIQAHSHAIHHFASIGYIIANLDIELPDTDFGYNPTTPKVVKQFA